MPDDPNDDSRKAADTAPAHSRRDALDAALKLSAVGLCGTALLPIARFATPPTEPETQGQGVSAGRREDFPARTSRLVTLDGDPVLVVAMPGGEIRAFGARCTHLGCVVQYRQSTEHIECPCHGGKYGLDGRVMAGPPPSPLPLFRVQIRDGEIVVVRG